jgi:2-keto-myo-inositol isomerase
MKLAMHEITTRDGTFLEHLAAYEKTGWRHFEINFWKAGEYIEKEGIERAAKAVRDHGLTCIAATGLGLATFADDKARAGDLETIRKYGAWMQALGCGPLVMGSNTPKTSNAQSYDVDLAALARHAGAVAAAGASFGVQLAIEVNWTGLCRSFRTAALLLKKVTQPNIGLVWDPAHFVSTPSRVEDLDLCRGRIIHAHLDDIRECYTEAMDINADRVLPGQGMLPMRAWTQKVAECGYHGYHSLELFNEKLWSMPLETICRLSREQCMRVWPEAEF